MHKSQKQTFGHAKKSRISLVDGTDFRPRQGITAGGGGLGAAPPACSAQGCQLVPGWYQLTDPDIKKTALFIVTFGGAKMVPKWYLKGTIFTI